MESSDIIKETITGLLQKTIEKKVKWTVVNPNAVKWEKKDTIEKTIVTLQRQPSPNPNIKEIFILTIQTLKNPPPRPAGVARPAIQRPTTSSSPIQISSGTDPSLKEILSSLYAEIFKEVSRQEEEKKLEIIKNLLNGV